MKQITQTGATVETAVEAALKELGAARDEVTIEVLQEEKKGFLGFGAKQAEVKVTVMEAAEAVHEETQAPDLTQTAVSRTDTAEAGEPEAEAEVQTEEQPEEDAEGSLETAIGETISYLQSVAKEMGVADLKVTHETAGKQVNFYLESEKVALLIGKRGNTLNSLQQLAQLVANKHARQFLIVQLDAENYRERRQETLEQLADRMADKAIRTGGRVQFEPMPSYERKVIHQFLSRRMDIDTYSEGAEPNRYLVIEPLND